MGIQKIGKITGKVSEVWEAGKVRIKEFNDLIDGIREFYPEDGSVVVPTGSVSEPSIVSTGAAGIIVGPTSVGFTTAASHEATLTGGGRWIVESTSTTGGIGIDTTTGLCPIIIAGATNNIAAAAGGAISVANYCTTINADGDGDAFTLADGVAPGQLKRIILIATAGGTGVVTSKFAGAATTLTFTNAGEFATLMWDGTDWIALELGSVITITHAPVIS